MTHHRTTRTLTGHEARLEEFDAHDKRGRRIGVLVSTWTAEYTPVPADTACAYGRAAGTYYLAEVQATRNGQRYGACQPYAHFETIAERDAYIARRIADSRKRAAKAGA